MRIETISPALLLGTALAIRIAFLVMPTGYDVYRYVWEGRILIEGFNPYVHPPDDPLLTPFRDEIWKSVGHPGATAIYPPLTQWLFAAMASFGLGPFGFKLIFTLADMVLCLLLCRRFGAKPALIYAWNPLAAVSIAGGGHYDSLFMLAMVIAWYFVWALPFAVKSRNAGFIALAASGVLYFIVHHTLEQLDGKWTFNWWERAAIWLPFITGFAVSLIHKNDQPIISRRHH